MHPPQAGLVLPVPACRALDRWQVASRANTLCCCPRCHNSPAASAPAEDQVRNLLAPVGIRLLADSFMVLQPLALWAKHVPGLPPWAGCLCPLPRLPAGCLPKSARAGTTHDHKSLQTGQPHQSTCSGQQAARWLSSCGCCCWPVANPRAGSPQFPHWQQHSPLQQALSVNMHMCATTIQYVSLKGRLHSMQSALAPLSVCCRLRPRRGKVLPLRTFMGDWCLVDTDLTSSASQQSSCCDREQVETCTVW